jgi:hypothetical protein
MYDYFLMFLNAVPIILGFLLLSFAAVGVWRGLSLRPHKPGHKPAPPPDWWYFGR